MNTLKEIGGILGFAAFGGMAVLAFLTFQQARHLKRLRDWAGRAPERAEAQEIRDAEATSIAASATGAAPSSSASGGADAGGPGRLAVFRESVAMRIEDFSRSSPFDPRLLIAGLVAVVVGLGIATSGFGLLGGDSGSDSGAPAADSSTTTSEAKVRVAVLNGTADEAGMAIPGIADLISKDVKSAGYRIGEVENAGAPYPTSVVMFADGSESDARDLAADLEDVLGETEIEEITPEIEAIAGNADLALIVGQDDQGI